MDTKNETAPAGGPTAARAEHFDSRTPADKTSGAEYSGAGVAGQYSLGVRRVLDALASLGEADRATVAHFFAARMVAVEPGPLMCPKEAAGRLGVSASTARTWCATGRLRSHRVGGRIRVAEADVAAFRIGGAR